MRACRLAPLLAALLLAACSGSDERIDARAEPRTEARVVAPRPDSAGWRFVYLAGPRLWVRYPIARVTGVRDEWTERCDRQPPLYANDEDTTTLDRLIVRAASANFDSAVAMAGFARDETPPGIVCVGAGCAQRHYALPDLPHGFALSYADSLAVGPWRALSAVIEERAYLDEGDSVSYVSPDDAPDATMPPSTLLRRRVVAVGPGTGHCAIVLALQTHTVLRRDERTEPLDSAVVREILAGARR